MEEGEGVLHGKASPDLKVKNKGGMTEEPIPSVSVSS